MNNYDAGDMVRITATFTNSAGVGVDPSSLTLQYGITKPVASVVTAMVYGVNSITRLGVGVYYADVDVNSGGEWHYRWAGKGANQAAAEGQFMVLEPRIG